MHGHGRQLQRAPATRGRIRPGAVDLLRGVRGRELLDGSRKHWQDGRDRPRQRFLRLSNDCTGAIVGVGFCAERDDRFVHFRLTGQIRRQSCRAADEQYEQSGGERIERTGMPDLCPA